MLTIEESNDPEALLRDAATGDQLAFARLYDLVAPRVFGLMLAATESRSAAERLTYATFLQVWQSGVRNFDPRESAEVCILAIAREHAVDHLGYPNRPLT